MSTRIAQLFYGVEIPKEVYEKLGPRFYTNWKGHPPYKEESTHPLFELEFFYNTQEHYLVASGTNYVAYDDILRLGQVLPVTRPSNPQQMIQFLKEHGVTGEPEWMIMPN